MFLIKCAKLYTYSKVKLLCVLIISVLAVIKMKGKILALWLLVLSEIFEYRSAFRVLKSGQSVPDASYFKPYDKVVVF